MSSKNAVFKKIIEEFSSSNESNFQKIKKASNFYKESEPYYYYFSEQINKFEKELYGYIFDLTNLIIEYEQSAVGIKVRTIKEHKIENIIDQISIIGNSLGYNFKKQIIREIFKQQKSPNNTEEKLMLDIGNSFYSVNYDEMNILTLSQKITGFTGFRDFDIKVNNETLTSYKEIPLRYNELNKMIDDDRFSPFLVASMAFYFIRTDKFFRSNNEMASILFLEKLISKFIPRTIMELLPIVEIINRYDSYIKKYIDLSMQTLDLSYVYVLVIAILSESVVDKYNFILEKFNDKSKDRVNLDMKQVNYYAKLLMSENPNISKRQALFYIEHRDKGSFYTIEDFRDGTSSSYETSRTSMDNLAKIGLYAKIKVGKKFVYKVI